MDEVLERLVLDGAFRDTLATDPDAALAGYDLTDEERETLAAHLDQGAGTSGRVEQRTSKSGLAGLFGALGGASGDIDGVSIRPVQEVSGDDTTPPAHGQAHVAPGDDDAAAASTVKIQKHYDMSSPYLKETAEVPLDDLRAADPDTDEVIQPTYPGVYIEEVAPPPSTDDSSGAAAAQHQESDLGFVSGHLEDAQPIDEHGRVKVQFHWDPSGAAADTDPYLQITLEDALVSSTSAHGDEATVAEDLATAAQPEGDTIREEMSLNYTKMELDEGGDGQENFAGASTGDAEEAGRPRTDDVTLERGTTASPADGPESG